MKLLFCTNCTDLFNLTYELKQCSCGLVKGKYVDHSNAVVNGEGHSIAIGNGSLYNAIEASKQPAGGREAAIEKNRIEYAWVRPHTGPDNPHTKVNPDL